MLERSILIRLQSQDTDNAEYLARYPISKTHSMQLKTKIDPE